ncbi:MAG: phosphotransferase protein, polymerase [Candidatus Levybacteria bacterium]|nr:phosphotransferase protein, polymerase [Candidatus Levybacteria bacterium]
MGNQEIARLFRNVAAAFSIKDSKKYYFQILAYQKASETIASSTTEVKDLFREGKLQTLPGIGITIQSRLEDLFKRGSVAHFNTVFKGIPESVFVLINIPSIGPKKAYKLAKELSLNNPKTVIEDLIIKANNHEIAKIPTFGEKSEQDILRSIYEYKEGKGKTTRMVLPFAVELAEKILTYLRQCPAVIEVFPLGSIRRMMPTIGDIDIAASSNHPKDVIIHFVAYPYKERIIEQGPETASILTSGGKQVDLMVQPPDSFGALLQHFTGSKDHNVHLREYALKKGLSLSERGMKDLKNNEKLLKYDTEEKFYNALGMDWIPPEIREDKGEIELALQNKLPELVKLSDIKGDLHLHSSFPIEPSHDLGHNDIKEMTEYAKTLGYEYLGFSEHNPSISKHTKDQIYSLIARRNDYIEHIQPGIKDVRIIKLLEIDILGTGKLAVDDKALELLDGAIVSIHSSFKTNKREMTKRVLAGLSYPKAKILAHPTGRMLNERPGYELDFDQIFDFCKKNNKALEINSWPNRLDLPDALIKEAIENGVKLIINTDSHEVSQMNLMKYGIAIARRGWSTKSDIINSLRYNDLMKWLKT